MLKKVLSLVTGVVAGTGLLIALSWLLASAHTEAAPPVTNASAGVDLSPGYSQEASSGTVVTYTHMVTNTGTTTDTFTLEAVSSEGWPLELLRADASDGTPLLSLRLDSGLTGTFVVSLTVPAGATGGIVDYTAVTATSQADTNVWATITDATTVKKSFVYLPLVARTYPPPWEQADGTAGIKVYDVTVCASDPTVLYAGTDAGLYRSDDGGDHWQRWALDGRVSPVIVNPLYCNEVFAAAWEQGIYRVVGQDQFLLISQGVDELRYVYGLVVTADGQTLYAGSDSGGVYKTATSSIDWRPANNGISSDDRRIRSLDLIGNTLYAGGRRCTYYYSGDWGNSWQTEHVLEGGQGGACEDAQVWAIAELGDGLFAGLGLDKGLYRRPQAGAWALVSGMPAVTVYRFGLLPDGSRLYAGTYGNGVYTCGLDGRCRTLPNIGLGTPYIRGLAKVPGARLLAGSDDGIWWVPLVP
jgi:hypothetical protein